MRGSVFVLSILVVAAACSSFDEGDGETPVSVGTNDGGGADGATDTTPSAPAKPERVTQVDGPFSALCASSRGVAWTQLNVVGAVIDGARRKDTDTDNTEGGCVLTQATLVYTGFAGVHTADFGDPEPDATPPEGTIAVSLQQPKPLATDGIVYFSAEIQGSKRVVETTGGPVKTLGIVAGTAKLIAVNTAQVIVATEEGELQRSTRSGVDPATKIGTQGNVITGLALVADRLYIATPSAIRSCVPPACEENQLVEVAAGLLGAAELVASGDDLYWVERDGDRVASCNRTTCGVPRLVAALPKPLHLALGDRIYVSDVENVIWAMPR